ncbi:transposase [Rubritalea sp.]|uniref:transposase n=1 Tax=Rubritalea sp. TaxID=2109375 RepID=UPI003EF8A7A7
MLSPWGEHQGASYHVVSRVVDRRFVLKRAEKEYFVKLMRLYEKFCGVEVLTYCVMSNHFHLLVRVPPQPKKKLSDVELIEKLRIVYSAAYVEQIEHALSASPQGSEEHERIRNRFLYRMWDLSEFMKVLKQRFTQWFNKTHSRQGTLWESRFKSVLVQDGYAARVMAAYIDLNPVRAGMVSDPKEYRWCGYAESVAGRRVARLGIKKVMESCEADAGQTAKRLSAEARLAEYRVLLFEDGAEAAGDSQLARSSVSAKRLKQRGMTSKQIQRVVEHGGKLTRSQMLRCRVRYFTDGAVLGSKAFVDSYFSQKSDYFPKKRQSGARKMRGVEESSIYSLRDLQVKPVG